MVTVALATAAPLGTVIAPRTVAFCPKACLDAPRTSTRTSNAYDSRKCFTTKVPTREDTEKRNSIIRLHTPFSMTESRLSRGPKTPETTTGCNTCTTGGQIKPGPEGPSTRKKYYYLEKQCFYTPHL